MKIFIIVSFLYFSSVSIAQLNLKIQTDKQEYEYGDPIKISCNINNQSNESIVVWSPCTSSYQAEFEFNEYYSYEWTSCLTAYEQITFEPNETRSYQWIIDPNIYGLPNKDNIQNLVGHFFYRDSIDSEEIELLDTLNIIALQYLGGQVSVTFYDSLLQEVVAVRNLLNAEIIESGPTVEGRTDELWQIEGISVDSVVNKYENDEIFLFFDYNRWISYSNVTTSIEVIESEIIPNEYSLTQNYPNPFNPSTTLKYEIPKESYITLKVYDILGREVATLVNEQQKAGYYEVEWDAVNNSSGIYFYRIQAGEFVGTKKMMLVK